MKKGTRILCIALAAAVCSLLFMHFSLLGSKHDENKLSVAVAYDRANNNIEIQNLEYLSRCVDAFQKQNPGVNVTVETIPLDTYSSWLYHSLLYGEAPDIFTVLPQDFPTLSSLGVLENIGADHYSDKIAPSILRAWTSGGILYAIPYATSPPCLIVNQSLLGSQELPIEDPTFDWFDFYYYCRNYTFDSDGDGVVDTFGVSGMDWRTAVYANGQTLFDIERQTTDFNNPEVEYSVKLATSMNKLTLEDYDGSFEDGHALIRVTNLAQARYFIKSEPRMDLMILRIPKGPDGNFRTEPYDYAFGISKNSGVKDTANRFLQFITLDEARQSDYLSCGYAFPVLGQVQQSARAREDMAPYIEPEILHLLLSESETIPIEFVEYYDLMGIADKEIFQYIQSNIDIESELGALNSRMTEMLQGI